MFAWGLDLGGSKGWSDEGKEGGIWKEHRETFGDDGYTYYLVMTILVLCKYVKTHQIVGFKYVHLLYVNYTLIRLKKKGKNKKFFSLYAIIFSRTLLFSSVSLVTKYNY